MLLPCRYALLGAVIWLGSSPRYRENLRTSPSTEATPASDIALPYYHFILHNVSLPGYSCSASVKRRIAKIRQGSLISLSPISGWRPRTRNTRQGSRWTAYAMLKAKPAEAMMGKFSHASSLTPITAAIMTVLKRSRKARGVAGCYILPP